LILAAAGVFLLLDPRIRLGGALLLAAGATAYRASRMVRVARLVEGTGAEALVVARAWSRPGPGSGLVRVGLVAVPVATLAATALVLTLGHPRLAPYVIGLGALSMVDLALGHWVDRQCRLRLGARPG
jgi:hypothetical protein